MAEQADLHATHTCDYPGCIAEGRHKTVMGRVYCDKCNDRLVVVETGCLVANGTPTPLAGWWRRLRTRGLV